MIYVVGSGHAGVTSAHALVRRGFEVTMLDAGVQLEPHRARIVDRLRAQDSHEWDPGSLREIRSPIRLTQNGLTWKSAYGSSFPYATGELAPIETHGVDASASLAVGGFSNVWGAAVLPYRASDLAEWPIGLAELAPYYEAAAALMNVSGVEDGLTREFPIYGRLAPPLRPSRQTTALMGDLEASADRLRAGGFAFGYSRLAVSAGGCAYCGLCQYGCPYQLVYNAGHTLAELNRNPRFRYVPDVLVEKVVESGGAIRVLGRSRSARQPLTFEGSRVFLACGALATTKVLLASLDAFERPVTLHDSHSFVLPLIRYRAVAGVVDERLYTLAQVFLALSDPALTARGIHFQVTTYNDNYLQALNELLGPLRAAARWALPVVLGRLLIAQGFLHSDDSPRIRATLRGDSRGSTLVLQAAENQATRRVIDGAIASLARHSACLKARPVLRMLRIRAPGGGFHNGGTFPMRANPGAFESDRWGRPSGFERVHATDATIFPTIPGGPIAYSIVANAYRIAAEHPA
jgi:choline dehydrogenase-like flavoprotein